MQFTAFIDRVHYRPCVPPPQPLPRYEPATFDVGAARSVGLLGKDVAYAVWNSPKRTRSYPLARTYHTLHYPRRVAVVPVIKDEGAQGANDRLNAMTFDWLSLFDIHIVLAWYEKAEAGPRPGRLGAQRLAAEYVRATLQEALAHPGTAAEWNRLHFERDFGRIFTAAVESYGRIAQETGVELHPADDHMQALHNTVRWGQADLAAFRQATLPASQLAANRESVTEHALEDLQDPLGGKGSFTITDRLGGWYHLTADEVLYDGGQFIIQEAKNTTRAALPAHDDVVDGLFKLMLYSNMDELVLAEEYVEFGTRLRLTGRVEGRLELPASPQQIAAFAGDNLLTAGELKLLRQLDEETRHNHRLSILITSST